MPAADRERDDATDGTGAAYVFRVRYRLRPTVGGVRVEPDAFETVLYRDADPPGQEGWCFFRDNLWRGELADPDHFRELTADALGVDVLSVSFSELRTTRAYLDALDAAIADRIGEFQQADPEHVRSAYLGSSIRVVE